MIDVQYFNDKQILHLIRHAKVFRIVLWVKCSHLENATHVFVITMVIKDIQPFNQMNCMKRMYCINTNSCNDTQSFWNSDVYDTKKIG